MDCGPLNYNQAQGQLLKIVVKIVVMIVVEIVLKVVVKIVVKIVLKIIVKIVVKIVSSVRSSYSHPDLLLITSTTPLFQITPVLNTGLSLSEPIELYKGYNAI